MTNVMFGVSPQIFNISEAPVGLLTTMNDSDSDGIIIFKTEHKNDSGFPECYVLASGEKYCASRW